jgi:hypothetical protein
MKSGKGSGTESCEGSVRKSGKGNVMKSCE